jgi:hypothetical protein
MSKHTLSTNNKRIYEFYKNNPSIEFETMNLIMIDFIEKLNNDMNKTISTTINNEILSSVKELKEQLTNVGHTLNETLTTQNKDFIENTKMIIQFSSTQESDKIIQQLNRNTEQYVDKISHLIPNSESKIQDNLNSFQRTLTTDIKEFLSANSSQSSLSDFISNLDSKIQAMQQPIYSFITSSQEQISQKINDNISDKTKQDKLHEDLTDFLNKYKTSSSYKGQYSENLLETTLNNLYPSAEVQNTHAQKACGDFMIRRDDKDDILIENKDYKVNVDIAEIKKFLRDINEQKTHGIFLSQFSGIVSKPNFFIEIQDGKVLVYLHNVEYNSDKINTAVSIIDNLSIKLSAINDAEEENGFSINKELLEQINKEFQEFLTQKETICKNIKDFHHRILPDIDKLVFPSLSTYLSAKYASTQNSSYCCNICGSFWPSKRHLASHKNSHNEKKKKDKSPVLSIETN